MNILTTMFNYVGITSFIRGLVFFSILNTIILVLVLLAIKTKASQKLVNNKYILLIPIISILFYVIVYILSLHYRFRSDLWNTAYALVALVVFVTLRFTSRKSIGLKLARITILSFIASSLMYMLIAYNRLHTPLFPDTGRYMVQTTYLLSNGKWIPYSLPENPYYQILNVQSYIPYYFLALSKITRVDLGYSVTSLVIFITFILVIAGLSLNIVRNESISSATILLFLLTPPLLIIPMAYGGQAISILLALMTISILLAYKTFQLPLTKLTITLSILIVGSVLSHIMGPLIILSIVLGIALYTRGKIPGYVHVLRILAVATLAVSLVYWFFTMILEDIIIHMTTSIYERIIRYFEAAAPPITLTVYEKVPVILAYSWTIVPSLVAAYYGNYMFSRLVLQLHLFKRLLKGVERLLEKFKHLYAVTPYLVHSLSIVSIAYLLLIFLLALSGLYPRYAYRWAYPLLIVPSTYIFYTIAKNASRKAYVVLAFIVFIAAIIASYDPQVVFEKTGSLSIASDRDLDTGISIGVLVKYIDFNYNIDRRLGPGFALGLSMSGFNYTMQPSKHNRVLVVIGFDRAGKDIARRILGAEYVKLYVDKGYKYMNIVYANNVYKALFKEG